MAIITKRSTKATFFIQVIYYAFSMVGLIFVSMFFHHLTQNHSIIIVYQNHNYLYFFRNMLLAENSQNMIFLWIAIDGFSRVIFLVISIVIGIMLQVIEEEERVYIHSHYCRGAFWFVNFGIFWLVCLIVYFRMSVVDLDIGKLSVHNENIIYIYAIGSILMVVNVSNMMISFLRSKKYEYFTVQEGTDRIIL